MNTNRRGFLSTLLKAGVGFSVLPAATTYARTWKRQRHLWVIDWENVQIGQIEANNELNTLHYVANSNGWYRTLVECEAVVDNPDGTSEALFKTIFKTTINHIDEDTAISLGLLKA